MLREFRQGLQDVDREVEVVMGHLRGRDEYQPILRQAFFALRHQIGLLGSSPSLENLSVGVDNLFAMAEGNHFVHLAVDDQQTSFVVFDFLNIIEMFFQEAFAQASHEILCNCPDGAERRYED